MKHLGMLLLIGTFVVGCGKKDEGGGGGGGAKPGAAAPAPSGGGGGTDCLIGSWVTKYGDKNIYTFNADKTGTRNYRDTTTTKFTWSMTDGKNGKVDFPAEGDTAAATFPFTIDCAKNDFTLAGATGWTKQ